MSKKSEFINYVETLIRGQKEPLEMSPEVKIYWEAFKGNIEADKPLLTDNGKVVLKYMQDNLDIEMFKAKDVADGIGISSRTVSGAMRKLVTDGFVEKLGQDPVIYAITEKGKNITID